ncbi:MAG: hypothetical protein ACI85I_002233 [Arenicella sp.]|jgi:hypothetical protein
MRHKTLEVTIRLNTLVCHERGTVKNWRKTTPYMWNIFFKLSNPSLTVNNEFKLEGGANFHFSQGSHGNLDSGHLEAGDSTDIPQDIGVWTNPLNSIDIPYFDYETPGIIGVVSALMEQRNVSRKGAEAGHLALNKYVERSINKCLTDFDVKKVDVKDIENSLKQYIKEEIDKLTEGIEQRITPAIIKAQNIVQNVWSLVDKDELIGFKIWYFNSEDLAESDMRIPLKDIIHSSSHGSWGIEGEMVGKEIHS